MAVGKYHTSSLSLIVLLTSLLFTGPAFSLGLGAIESGSLLGEPLSVRIPVLDSLREYRAEDLIIRKLDNKQAEELGFEVVTSSYGITLLLEDTTSGVVLLARSKSPITEPFISFFVELQWPQGSLIREYTLLLDPPALPSAVQASVSAHSESVQAAAKTVSKRPDLTKIMSTSRAAASVSAAVSKAIAANASNYRVQPGDSLSVIAGRWVAGQQSGESVQATTQWLFENNPEAFVGGNMNRLMAGVRLQLPADGQVSNPTDSIRTEAEAAKETAAVSSAAATSVSEKLAENSDGRAWMGNLPQRPEDVGAALQQANNNDVNAPSAHAGLVRLSQDAESLNEVPSFAELESESPESVQSYLDSTRETIDVLRRENAQLNRQIEAIENSDYLNNLKELVELQRLQLAQLKNELNADSALDEDVERYAAIVADRAINSVDGKADSGTNIQGDTNDKSGSLIQIEEDINLQQKPIVPRATGKWIAAWGLFLLAVILFLMIVRRLWIQQQDKYKTRILPIPTAPTVVSAHGAERLVGTKSQGVASATAGIKSEVGDLSDLLDEDFQLDSEDLKQFGPIDFDDDFDDLIAVDHSTSLAEEPLAGSEFEDTVPESNSPSVATASIDDDWDDLFNAIVSKQLVDGKEPEGFDLQLDIEDFLDDAEGSDDGKKKN